jgi:hypothetical protein
VTGSYGVEGNKSLPMGTGPLSAAEWNLIVLISSGHKGLQPARSGPKSPATWAMGSDPASVMILKKYGHEFHVFWSLESPNDVAKPGF